MQGWKEKKLGRRNRRTKMVHLRMELRMDVGWMLDGCLGMEAWGWRPGDGCWMATVEVSLRDPGK